MQLAKIIIISLLFISSNISAHPLEKLFYLTGNIDNLPNLKTSAKAIDIMGPQIYELASNGAIAGIIDSNLLAFAKEHHLKIMPLITNPNFSQEKFHDFLVNPGAINRAIASMLTLCQQNHLYGLQFDFENISLNDKQAFTAFFQLTAAALHQQGYALSVAVIPRFDDVTDSPYEEWFFKNWSSAYDYPALAQSGDFITIMSYDQHTSLTTPGPIASAAWVEKIILHLLEAIPPTKISLGIPTYSGYWTTNVLGASLVPERYSFRSKEAQIGYPKLTSLLAQFDQKLIWNKQWQSSYAIYDNHGHNEYIFAENAQSFKAKLALAKKYHLRGISVWKLGLEDPAIWNVLNPALTQHHGE